MVLLSRPHELSAAEQRRLRVHRHHPSVGLGRTVFDVIRRQVTERCRPPDELGGRANSLRSGCAVAGLNDPNDSQKERSPSHFWSSPQGSCVSLRSSGVEFKVADEENVRSTGTPSESISLTARRACFVLVCSGDLCGEGVTAREVERSTARQRETPGVRVTANRAKRLRFTQAFVVAAPNQLHWSEERTGRRQDEIACRNSATALSVGVGSTRLSVPFTGRNRISRRLAHGGCSMYWAKG